MPSYIANNSVFNKIKTMHLYNLGSWKNVKGAWRYINDEWIKVYSSDPSIAMGDDCILLLHGEDLVDHSPIGRTDIIKTGAVSFDSDSVFGGSSMRFYGNGNTIQVTGGLNPFYFGNSNFTVDYWIKRNGNQTTYAAPFSTGPSGPGYLKMMFQNSTQIYAQVGGTTLSGSSSSSIPNLTWTHVALTRSGTAVRVFLNGNVVISGTISANTIVNGNDLWLGVPDIGSTSMGFNGWIDEFRVRKGTAEWTSNFTPPMFPYGDDTNIPD